MKHIIFKKMKITKKYFYFILQQEIRLQKEVEKLKMQMKEEREHRQTSPSQLKNGLKVHL